MTGEALNLARKRRAWTQQELARRLGVSQPYVALLEAGKRRLPRKLQRKAVRLLGLGLAALPLPELPNLRQSDSRELAQQLTALGYPGFAYMRSSWRRNPAEVVLTALAQENLESRLAEALPWVLFHHPQADHNWLVAQARLHNLQNRLGFVVSLARRVAERTGRVQEQRQLSELEVRLQGSRLAKEDTLCQSFLSAAEREWLRQNRPTEAQYWNLLTDWKLEHLRYVD